MNRQIVYELEKSRIFRWSLAALDPLESRMRPAGRVFETDGVRLHSWPPSTASHFHLRLEMLKRIKYFSGKLSRQFHQHFTRAFFVRIFCQSQNVTRKAAKT